MAVYGKIDDIIKNNKFEHKIGVALKYLRGLDKKILSGKPVGYSNKVEIRGKDIFAIHQVYKTKPVKEARFEAHRKYIDLQYIWKGEELIPISFSGKLKVIRKYDKEKDVEFYKYFPAISLVMEPGDLAILYPSDAHAPGLVSKKQQLVRKTVVKVKV